MENNSNENKNSAEKPHGKKLLRHKVGVSCEDALKMENQNSIRGNVKESLKSRFKMPKRGFKVYFFRYAILIPFISFLVAASYYCFVTPNSFAPGGIYGLGSMVENSTQGKIPMGIVVFLISIPLVVGAFWVLDLESAINITYMMISASLFSVLMTRLNFYQFKAEMPDGTVDKVIKLFAAIIGGFLSGAMFGYTIKFFGVADGTIALAAIIKKKRPNLSIAWATFAFDLIVVTASFFVYWETYTAGVADSSWQTKITYAIEPIIYSVANMFVISKVCDVILKGLQSAYKFEVITDKPEIIGEEIMKKLERGVTMIPAKGMYSGADKAILVCIVRKRQIGDFHRIIKSHPETFAYITSSSEVFGYFSK